MRAAGQVRRHTPWMVAAIVFAVAGCGLFGRDRADPLPEPARAPFPDLGRVPSTDETTLLGDSKAAQQAQEERTAQLRRLEIRRVVAELERDVLNPELLEQLPAAPSLPRTPLIPRRLIRRTAAPKDAPLAPPPSEMPPVLPAGGVPGERPGGG